MAWEPLDQFGGIETMKQKVRERSLGMSYTPRTSAWWRAQYPGWPSMSRERMEMLFSDLAEAERGERIHLEALAESERLRVALEDDVKTYQSGAEFLRERAEKAEGERDEANARAASVTLDNARLRKLVLNGRCASSQTAANEVWEHEAAALIEDSSPDAMVERVRLDIQRVHDLCFGYPVSVGTPGDVSHVDRDHAEAHRILDALLGEIGGPHA